jgi:hypothetical protein
VSTAIRGSTDGAPSATLWDYKSGEHVPVVADGKVVGQIAVDGILP